MKERINGKILCCLFTACLALWLPTSSADSGTAELCNKGDLWLYFTRLGRPSGLLSTTAVYEGFIAVGPGQCASLVPYSMAESTIALFQQDSQGVLGNIVMTPTTGRYSNDHPEYLCVRPRGAFRIFGNESELVRKFTGACPTGFVKAKTSFTITLGTDNQTLNASGDSSARMRPWGGDPSLTRIRPETLSEGERNKSNRFVAENKIVNRNREAAAELLKQGANFVESIRRGEAEKRRQKNLRHQRARQERQRISAEAQALLEYPGDEVCASYQEKDLYKKVDRVALFGVQIGTSPETAHVALLCNGFTIPLREMTRRGGARKFFLSQGTREYTKTMSNGQVLVSAISVTGQRTQRNRVEMIVTRVAVTYQLTAQLDKKGWKQIQKDFKRKYKFGKYRKSRYGLLTVKKKTGKGTDVVERTVSWKPYKYPNRNSSYVITLF